MLFYMVNVMVKTLQYRTL